MAIQLSTAWINSFKDLWAFYSFWRVSWVLIPRALCYAKRASRYKIRIRLSWTTLCLTTRIGVASPCIHFLFNLKSGQHLGKYLKTCMILSVNNIKMPTFSPGKLAHLSCWTPASVSGYAQHLKLSGWHHSDYIKHHSTFNLKNMINNLI